MDCDNKKPVPVLFRNNNECTGCSACYAICPKSAINMVADYEGFFYPEIDSSICIRCELCLKVCPLKK